jgi:hypothetical protein
MSGFGCQFSLFFGKNQSESVILRLVPVEKAQEIGAGIIGVRYRKV